MKRIVAAVSLIAWLCVAWPAVGADKPTVVELWPGKVPDETGDIGSEKVRTSPMLTRKEVGPTPHEAPVQRVPKRLTDAGLTPGSAANGRDAGLV